MYGGGSVILKVRPPELGELLAAEKPPGNGPFALFFFSSLFIKPCVLRLKYTREN